VKKKRHYGIIGGRGGMISRWYVKQLPVSARKGGEGLRVPLPREPLLVLACEAEANVGKAFVGLGDQPQTTKAN